MELQAVPVLIRGYACLALFVLWELLHFSRPSAVSAGYLFTFLASGFGLDEFLDKVMTGFFPKPWPHGLKIDIALEVPAEQPKQPK